VESGWPIAVIKADGRCFSRFLPDVQPYLKYHNPRTFEDLSKPVPNFRSM
jgi:hypothetical protein